MSALHGIRAGAVVAFVWAVSSAQAPSETVRWTATVLPTTSAQTSLDVRATVALSAEVQDGWHVYALTQPPGGPTPLRLTLDDNAFARVVGAPSGTTPEKKYDPSFDLQTQYYVHSFTLYLPVRVNRSSAAGGRRIPVSVRFQTCNGRECEPPRTVHLSVPIEAGAGT